jgi:hypothetical protein
MQVFELQGRRMKMVGKEYPIKIIADQSLVDHLQSYSQDHSQEVTIQPLQEDVDATRLGFDFVTAGAVLVLIKTGIEIVKIALEIVKWLRENKANKAILQTPYETIEIWQSDTDETVRKKVEILYDEDAV